MKRRLSSRGRLTPYLFLAPMMLGLLIFRIVPVGVSFAASFTQWNVFSPPRWVGLANYRALWDSPAFWQVLSNTALFALMYIPGVMVAGLALALLVDRGGKGIAFFRGLYFMPYITSVVAVALAWKWVFSTRFGILNNALRQVGVADPPGWLSDPEWALVSIAIVYVWQNSGFIMLLFLAGLQTVDDSYIEAARIDGARSWQIFRHITLPLLVPVGFFILIICLVASTQTFEATYALTKGGPNGASTTLAYDIYQNAFVFFRMGYASAIAYVLFLILVAVTFVSFAVRRRWAPDA